MFAFYATFDPSLIFKTAVAMQIQTGFIGLRSPLPFLYTALLLLTAIFAIGGRKSEADKKMLVYRADVRSEDFRMYWKDDANQPFGSIDNLKNWLEAKNQQLVFAMNGGMYRSDRSPVGLYIQEGKVLSALDTAAGQGNFYLKPNGIFYTTEDKKAVICPTADFVHTGNIRYATQSGPMLLVDGQIHPAFKEGSANVHIRNGVGILPDGTVLFVLSKERVNLYDFANYFKTSGCRNALYLDGFVSRAYLPAAHWIETDGDFGVIMGVVAKR